MAALTVAASPLIFSGLQKSQRAMGQHVNALGVTLGDASDGSDFRSSIDIQDDAWDFFSTRVWVSMPLMQEMGCTT